VVGGGRRYKKKGELYGAEKNFCLSILGGRGEANWVRLKCDLKACRLWISQ